MRSSERAGATWPYRPMSLGTNGFQTKFKGFEITIWIVVLCQLIWRMRNIVLPIASFIITSQLCQRLHQRNRQCLYSAAWDFQFPRYILLRKYKGQNKIIYNTGTRYKLNQSTISGKRFLGRYFLSILEIM